MPFTWDTSRFATPPREGPLTEEDTERLNARITDCDALLVALSELPELDADRMSRVLMYKAMACAELGRSGDAVNGITEAARVATATVRQLHDLAGVLVREGHLQVAIGVEELALGHSVDDAERWGEAVRARERIHVFLSAAYLGEATAATEALDDLLELGEPALMEVQRQASRSEHKPALLVSLLLAEVHILANVGRQSSRPVAERRNGRVHTRSSACRSLLPGRGLDARAGEDRPRERARSALHHQPSATDAHLAVSCADGR